jgi:TonB family protein
MVVYPIALIVATLLSGPPHSGVTASASSVSIGMLARASSKTPVPRNAGSWITASDYPPEARVARRTGKTGFRVRVNRKGQVDSCEVTESSGHFDLDIAACKMISERALFEPARNRKGQAIGGVYQNAVRWQLP